MISCPECQAKNEHDAKVCQQCGATIAPAPASEALPPWLQALKPENDEAPAPAAVATPTKAPVAAPVAVGAGAAPRAATPRPARAEQKIDGTDSVVATQPTAPRRAAPPEAARPAARQQAAPPPPAPGTTDTASLISEDDLPGWLRAFSENDGNTSTAKADDQSWMTGGADGADDALVNNLAQSWQTPARVAGPQRAGAVSVFGAPDESRAKVARVEKTAPAPAPTPVVALPEQKLSAPLPTTTSKSATPAAPARLGSNRAAAKGNERGGSSIQRMATIAFLVAFVIFLIVLGIFVIAPALGA